MKIKALHGLILHNIELNEYELEALEQFLSLADEIKYNENEIKSILIRYQ